MSKSRYKTTNWQQYNQALINRGSFTFWIDEDSIAKRKAKAEQPMKARPRVFSDLVITTALMVKRVVSMPCERCKASFTRCLNWVAFH